MWNPHAGKQLKVCCSCCNTRRSAAPASSSTTSGGPNGGTEKKLRGGAQLAVAGCAHKRRCATKKERLRVRSRLSALTHRRSTRAAGLAGGGVRRLQAKMSARLTAAMSMLMTAMTNGAAMGTTGSRRKRARSAESSRNRESAGATLWARSVLRAAYRNALSADHACLVP